VWSRRERAEEEGVGIEGGLECVSKLIPKIREKRLPATIGDRHMYPQFSEKWAETQLSTYE
jgi:hypothetical protein